MRIYHTSDMHDRHGFAARLEALRERAPGLLVDCGDSLRGSQTVFHRNEPIVAEIDAAKYDLQAMGNREFHYLFGAVRARAAMMKHPLLCSNLIDTKGRALPFHRDYILALEVPTHFLGLLVTQYPQGSPWEKLFGWRFLDPIEVVRRYAERIPAGEALVVLSHLGLSMDRRLAAAVERIDLILGGHSHDTLFAPEYVGEVPIVHAGPYARYVSRTELAYDGGARRFRIADFELMPLLENRE